MSLSFYNTHSCAMKEIDGVSCQSPEESIKSFCQQNLQRRLAFRGIPADHETVYSFYIFSDAVYNDPNEEYEASGSQLASYIRRHKLGKIWATRPVQNVAFHNDHCNQVWIWAPNLPALKAWWAKHKS